MTQPHIIRLDDLDSFKGCIYGLAIGDALGWPVEFSKIDMITSTYGPKGVRGFQRETLPYQFTDDTQMSLATAWGLLDAREAGSGDPTKAIYKRYLDWLRLQSVPGKARAPGGTCLSALRSGKIGSIDHPINDSKGCGGVMRTAPVGLLYAPDEAFYYGARAAAITHGHPSGYLPAGFLSAMISSLVAGASLDAAYDEALDILNGYSFCEETVFAVESAVGLAEESKGHSFTQHVNTIHEIGGGWVGEEALAISLYCVFAFKSFDEILFAAVNHNGDSDSTGSIAGAIAGLRAGAKRLPSSWVAGIEDREELEATATLLHTKHHSARVETEVPPANV